MGRTHWVTVHHLQQLVRRAVCGQRVRRRVVAVQPVLAILIGTEFSPQVVWSLVLRVLEIVFPVGRSLPDIKYSARDGLAGHEITDDPVHEAHTSIRSGVLDDGCTVITERNIRGPEGSQNGRGRRVHARVGDNLVGDFVDESRGYVRKVGYSSAEPSSTL